MTAKKPKHVTKSEASEAGRVLETRKEQIAEPKAKPFLRCGDCDTKSPEGTAYCPKCGYEL